MTEDRVGLRFTRLVTIEHLGNNIYRCLCDCGNIVKVSFYLLKSGNTKSCGCYNLDAISARNSKDISGRKFGRLTAIRRAYKYKNQHYWECSCECGKTTYVQTRQLISGNTKSCGCYCIDRIKETVTKHGMYRTKEYETWKNKKRRDRVIKHDFAWTVGMEVCLRTLFDRCVVCGITNKEHLELHNQQLHVDHVLSLNSGNGLVPGNATILCRSCNLSKFYKTLNELPSEIANRIVLSAELFKLVWEDESTRYSYLGDSVGK